MEDAIRRTDAFGRGFLEKEQLTECLIELGYLRNINSTVQLMQTQTQVEQGFLNALWSILNPR